MSILDAVLEDLAGESQQLDSWVASLDAAGWRTVTTTEGWTVAHQVAHLHWTDVTSVTAINDPVAFGAVIRAAAANPEGFTDEAAAELALEPPESLLQAWREGRGELVEALLSVPAGDKIAWFGPRMSPASLATARMMETWAHAHDVADALGFAVPRTNRVKHVCHLGVRTRAFAYQVRGEPDPGIEIRVELTGPDGELWTWGRDDATERVWGDAWDFALLATRRRHRVDADVHADGEHGEHWLGIVQAFAGSPGNDPLPLRERG